MKAVRRLRKRLHVVERQKLRLQRELRAAHALCRELRVHPARHEAGQPS